MRTTWNLGKNTLFSAALGFKYYIIHLRACLVLTWLNLALRDGEDYFLLEINLFKQNVTFDLPIYFVRYRNSKVIRTLPAASCNDHNDLFRLSMYISDYLFFTLYFNDFFSSFNEGNIKLLYLIIQLITLLINIYLFASLWNKLEICKKYFKFARCNGSFNDVFRYSC